MAIAVKTPLRIGVGVLAVTLATASGFFVGRGGANPTPQQSTHPETAQLTLDLPLKFNPFEMRSTEHHDTGRTEVFFTLRGNESVALKRKFRTLELVARYGTRNLEHLFWLEKDETRWIAEFATVGGAPPKIPCVVQGVTPEGARLLVHRTDESD